MSDEDLDDDTHDKGGEDEDDFIPMESATTAKDIDAADHTPDDDGASVPTVLDRLVQAGISSKSHVAST